LIGDQVETEPGFRTNPLPNPAGRDRYVTAPAAPAPVQEYRCGRVAPDDPFNRTFKSKSEQTAAPAHKHGRARERGLLLVPEAAAALA
jgi:hypothetical protein